ncbi:ABC transporter substrate-binding protein [Actinacidiphila sp. ITFR-21]|uniref:ABC transporter substrate-binding protein n=1 Tax=Actinacidiphila sp. ITFR-21 TaxID=3075199 RepID=UPI00288B7002|nr:extracellular solute-binding protein [Streptomyces sp. ITFR-21]WNI16046.1 extracellular solute-binding protein [Streptomyces sp. ITFR-21]
MAMTSLSGCGGSNPLGGDVTLHFVAADYGDPKTGNSSATYWNELVSAFQQKNPHIKVDVQVLSWDVVDDTVAKMVKAGKAPDIAQIGSYAAYAAQDQLYSADELFTVSEQADFIPSLVTAGSVDRVQYGIPWVSSSRMFFYNKKLFADAGISKAPQDWADIEKDARKLKKHGVKVPYGLPLGPEEAQAESLMWMLGNQGTYTDTVGSYTFDSENNVDALNWVRNHLVQPGLVQATDPAKTNRADIFADFLAGKAGMVMGHPSLLTQAEAAHLDVGVVPLPGQSGPSTDTLGVADWMMAFKQNGNKKADGEFLQYVFQEENAVKFLDEYGLLPVTTSASQAMRANPKDKDLVQFLQLLPDAVFYPVNKTSWGPVSAKVKTDIGQAMHTDAKPVLSKLQIYAQSQDIASNKTP